jgi:hypothetical protein
LREQSDLLGELGFAIGQLANPLDDFFDAAVQSFLRCAESFRFGGVLFRFDRRFGLLGNARLLA